MLINDIYIEGNHFRYINTDRSLGEVIVNDYDDWAEATRQYKKVFKDYRDPVEKKKREAKALEDEKWRSHLRSLRGREAWERRMRNAKLEREKREKRLDKEWRKRKKKNKRDARIANKQVSAREKRGMSDFRFATITRDIDKVIKALNDWEND